MTSERRESAISLVEEEAHVTKSQVLTGKVRIKTVTELQHETATATLEETKVEVRRVEIDRLVDQVPATRTQGDSLIIPILEEVLVVEKKLLLKAELHVKRDVTSHTFETPITLRKQKAVIERLDADGTFQPEEIKK